MGKPSGFLEIERKAAQKRAVDERKKDYKEVELPFDTLQTTEQATRCMDCGVPFCHNGCPLGNNIPEFNDAVYEGNWEYAFKVLDSTNNFPEFTGRICPAPCESACVLGINKNPVAIEYIEKSIVEKAYEEGWVIPKPPKKRLEEKVAVVGSGPAGLAAAAQLNKAGYNVTVLERSDQLGGLLRYGIPDFKLESYVIDRRIEVLHQEGIEFKTGVNVGVNYSLEKLKEDYDAVLLTTGSTIPRDLDIPGRDLKGVHWAMDYLTQQNQSILENKGFEVDKTRNHRAEVYSDARILATDKDVYVIGGGDTGADCVGTANRQGAKAITQLAHGVTPPAERDASTPWPMFEFMMRTSSSHEEGCERLWATVTKEFVGDENGNLVGIRLVDRIWDLVSGKMVARDVPESERVMKADLALLAIGFTGPENFIENLRLDVRGNIYTENYHTSEKGIFAAGDCRRGQSLVVWAIAEGREAARAIDVYLSGSSMLEAKEVGMVSAGFVA